MGTHRDAVEAAVKAGKPRLTSMDDPLLQLVRALADQVDDCGQAGPGTRLAGTYLTALRTLATRMGVHAPAKEGRLGQLRSIRGGKAEPARRARSA